MKVTILKPYGYCVGVTKAINLIHEVAANNKDLPIYCIGEIVHNRHVNEQIEQLGVKVLKGNKEELIDNINNGIVIFQAHGTDNKIVQKAKDKGLIVYDAMCTYVKKDFDIIRKYLSDGYDIIYIGKKGHPESEAAISIDKSINFIETVEDVSKLNIQNTKIAVANQTTLSLLEIVKIFDAIKDKYPEALIIDEICSFTRIRQENLLKELNKDYDGIIVIGGSNSNNVKSLYNIALNHNSNTIVVDCYENIDKTFLEGKNNVLLVSGASTPNYLVEEIYNKLIG